MVREQLKGNEDKMDSKLENILAKHAEWAADNSKGQCADLSGADLKGVDLSDAYLSGANLSGADLSGANLSGANLSGADLRCADLGGADLSDAYLRGANLSDVDLGGANLRWANLRHSDLRGANLSGANLSDADLRGANLSGADLDFSSGIPLWYGGVHFTCDAKLIQQVLAHLCTLDCKDKQWVALRKAIRPFAKKSHRASDLGLIKQKKG